MFTINDIAEATCGRVIGSDEGEVSGISTVSRSVSADELVVPLCGTSFDGHDYLASVTDKGVQAVLASESWLAGHSLPGSLTCIAGNDTLRALGDLAAAYRRRYDVTLIGITGSNGKPTCKEMLATILEQIGPGLKTAGNLNNLIGLPQMLFRLRPEHGWAVLEMGMSEPGEIDRLAEIAAPQVGVLLNAFPAHLESMGNVANVARAKGERLQRLPAGGCAVVNADDPLIACQPSPEGVRRITFGVNDAEIRASAIELIEVPKRSQTGKNSAVVTGDLVFHGVTKPVTLKVKFNAAGINPLDHKYTAGFEVSGEIKRSDFGVKTYLPLIGDDVGLIISAAFEHN